MGRGLGHAVEGRLAVEGPALVGDGDQPGPHRGGQAGAADLEVAAVVAVQHIDARVGVGIHRDVGDGAAVELVPLTLPTW